MTQPDWQRFRAILFDLDGVLTPTADIHAAAWKTTFDEYLRERSRRTGEPFQPFDPDADYRRWVDGRPRYDGVAAFLASRGITLPWGTPDDPPTAETVCGIGNRKNETVRRLLVEGGIAPYPGSVRFLEAVRRRGLRTAVVSSSANARAVLAAAGLEGFDTVVDGVVAAERGLKGKPAPDIFWEAARRLGVEPTEAVVVEDAVAGVEAGLAGGFGLIVGVDRHGDPDALREAGADVVVSDLGELA